MAAVTRTQMHADINPTTQPNIYFAMRRAAVPDVVEDARSPAGIDWPMPLRCLSPGEHHLVAGSGMRFSSAAR